MRLVEQINESVLQVKPDLDRMSTEKFSGRPISGAEKELSTPSSPLHQHNKQLVSTNISSVPATVLTRSYGPTWS